MSDPQFITTFENPFVVSEDDSDEMGQECANIPDADSDANLAQYQHSFLLQQLEDAPGHSLTRADANRALRADVRRRLGLTVDLANQIREELADDRLIRIRTVNRNHIYELTAPGRRYLRTLPLVQDRPTMQSRVTTVGGEVRDYQRAYLLLQLFRAPEMTLSSKEANRFDRITRETLSLNAATAKEVRRSLAKHGYLEIESHGRSETLMLTREGVALLGTLRYHPEMELRLTGEELNELLAAARASLRELMEEID